MVSLGGLLPASLLPSRSASTGAASTSMIASPATAPGQGWRWIVLAHEAQKPCGAAPGSRGFARSRRLGRPMRGPRRDSAAGRTVRAASIVISTASAEATASPYRKLTPSRNWPSRAMITVTPANTTARPAESIASSIADWSSAPARKFSRKRVTMNSA